MPRPKDKTKNETSLEEKLEILLSCAAKADKKNDAESANRIRELVQQIRAQPYPLVPVRKDEHPERAEQVLKRY